LLDSQALNFGSLGYEGCRDTASKAQQDDPVRNEGQSAAQSHTSFSLPPLQFGPRRLFRILQAIQRTRNKLRTHQGKRASRRMPFCWS